MGEEIFERGQSPLSSQLPLPLLREGGQGDRLLNNLIICLGRAITIEYLAKGEAG